VIITVGAFAGQWMAVMQKLDLADNFWFGHQVFFGPRDLSLGRGCGGAKRTRRTARQKSDAKTNAVNSGTYATGATSAPAAAIATSAQRIQAFPPGFQSPRATTPRKTAQASDRSVALCTTVMGGISCGGPSNVCLLQPAGSPPA
jgi:hypothetical protein